MSKEYEVILADCPWDYRGQVQTGGPGMPFTSSAASFYSTMPVEDICALPVKKLRAKTGSCLFLWVPGALLEDGLAVMEAWGYKYKQIAFCWDKERVNPGAYTMTQIEYVLVGTYKTIPKPRGSRNERQLISSVRTRHSEKPSDVHEALDRMFPSSLEDLRNIVGEDKLEKVLSKAPEGWTGHKKLEMFARRKVDGWDCIGNEITGNDIRVDLERL